MQSVHGWPDGEPVPDFIAAGWGRGRVSTPAPRPENCTIPPTLWHEQMSLILALEGINGALGRGPYAGAET